MIPAAPAFREVLNLFLPRGCLSCGSRIPPEEVCGLVCAPCRLRLRPIPAPFCPRCQAPRGTGQAAGEVCLECRDWPPVLVSARAAVVMDSISGALVHALKYGGWGNIAEVMGEKMALEPVAGLSSPVVVPVPTTPWRKRTRGYNQAAVLARFLGGRWALPVEEVLVRSSGRTQVKLTPRERAENVREVFHAPERFRSRIRDREVILVDDVLTTGSTARAAAKALEVGGADAVHLRTFARALSFSLR